MPRPPPERVLAGRREKGGGGAPPPSRRREPEARWVTPPRARPPFARRRRPGAAGPPGQWGLPPAVHLQRLDLGNLCLLLLQRVLKQRILLLQLLKVGVE